MVEKLIPGKRYADHPVKERAIIFEYVGEGVDHNSGKTVHRFKQITSGRMYMASSDGLYDFPLDDMDWWEVEGEEATNG